MGTAAPTAGSVHARRAAYALFRHPLSGRKQLDLQDGWEETRQAVLAPALSAHQFAGQAPAEMQGGVLLEPPSMALARSHFLLKSQAALALIRRVGRLWLVAATPRGTRAPQSRSAARQVWGRVCYLGHRVSLQSRTRGTPLSPWHRADSHWDARPCVPRAPWPSCASRPLPAHHIDPL